MSADPAEVIEPLEIAYVGAENLTYSLWWQLANLLEPACDETLSVQDIRMYIAKKEAIAWLIHERGDIVAAAVTRVHEHDGHKWLDVLALGGEDWHRWAAQLHVEFEVHAKAIGCHAVEAHVRRGMEKWLKRLGWRVRQVLMEYRIDG